MPFDEAAYLARTGAKAPSRHDLDSLAELSRAQAFTVPFENFDILLGRGVDVSPEAVFDKLVHRHRGGYCFELNGLLLQALRHFGFDARALLARVHVSGEPAGRTHQISQVHIDGEPWIVDVGFGVRCPRYPMSLERKAVVQEYEGLRFRFMDVDPWGVMLQIEESDAWLDVYSFDLTTVCQGDIETGNHFTSTSPKSFFTKMRIATMPNELGRDTLGDLRLTRTVSGNSRVEQVPDGERYLALLEELFGIDLDVRPGELPPIA